MQPHASFPNERRVAFMVEYDGTDYLGWQSQRGDLPTIQGSFRRVLDDFFGRPTPIDGASRTDAGVHAFSQVAAISIIHPIQLSGLEKLINSRLPKNIAIRSLREVANDFFPRHAVREKTYEYNLYVARWQRPLIDRFATRTSHDLCERTMHEAAMHLIGTHDFTSFAASDGKAKTNIRTLKRISITAEDPNRIRMRFTGTAFLKQMVRNLVGSLIEVGRGHRSPAWLLDALHAQDRTKAGPTAPARGLTLLESDVNWSHGLNQKDNSIPNDRSA